MKVVWALAAVLGMAGAAGAQSLLGDSTRSPYDPPAPRVYKKHDPLRVVAGEAALSVEVADVRPNGTLVLQAVRRVRVNGREGTLKLTGEAAAGAVERGSVKAADLHNLHVVLEGPEGEPWVARLFKTGWPF